MGYKQLHFFSGNSVDPLNVSFSIRGTPYVDRFKVLSVNIPLAYNTTDSSNNVIVFERSGSTKRASVPPGSYNAATFPAALQAALNDVSTVKDFTVTFNEVTRALVIAASTPFTIQPFQGGTTAYRQIGMNKFSPAGTGTSVTFGMCDFTNTSPLLLTSSTLVSKDMSYVNEENINVLAMVDTNAPQASVARWENTGGWVHAGQELSRVDFKFLNAATLLPIELSQPYSVTIGILTDQDDLAE